MVEEAAVGRRTLIATRVSVAVGGRVLVPSRGMLFGLVLRGRSASEAHPTALGSAAPQVRPRISPLRLTPALGAVGVLLVLAFDGGLFLAVGIAALLALVALGWVAIVSSSVVEDRQVE